MTLQELRQCRSRIVELPLPMVRALRSIAGGEARPDSDVDLLVDMDSDAEQGHLAKLGGIIRESQEGGGDD